MMFNGRVKPIRSDFELEDELSVPSRSDVESLNALSGDILILGAGGKMGPSLARLARRAADAGNISRRVIAASGFSQPSVRAELEKHGIETIPCNLLDEKSYAMLPSCANVLYLAGRKFGSSDRPDLTWASNVVIPAFAANRFRDSRIVAFSTGNVYSFVKTETGGSVEGDLPQPVGEYAQSCLGRERIFEHCSLENGTKTLLLRLNYAVDLRYGVLVDIAQKVFDGKPVDLSVGYFNVIWQRDANSYALRGLALCESPPRILNVTGTDILSVRSTAQYFAREFGREPVLVGSESTTALLSNASLCRTLLGQPVCTSAILMAKVADWIRNGGSTLNKPTHFEVRNGRY